MKQYLNIIQQEVSKVTEEDLYKPIQDTGIDSLDLVVIRVHLEKYFGIVIPDSIWYSYDTLSEALKYFQQHQTETHKGNEPEIDVSIFDKLEIRMPQMGNSALSENWLLKYIGDNHWQLLSKGFSKKSSEFEDDQGNRLYATFVRIKYNSTPLNCYQENEILEFNSNIHGFGNNTFISSIHGRSEFNSINATLMTIFSTRYNDDNDSIKKGNPFGEYNFKRINSTPSFLNDYRLLKNNLLDELSTDDFIFPITVDVLFEYEYEINPFYDINGVGLLYFASYPIISDKCMLKYPEIENLSSYHTIYRDISYFANCNPNDKIIFQLNCVSSIKNQLLTVTSLFRDSDKQPLAKLFTVKQS